MKIGILTQQLHSNYGGLLQAWALQKVLEDMGHSSEILQRDYVDIYKPSCINMARRLKLGILKLLGNGKLPLKEEELLIIRKNTNAFISKYHTVSPVFESTKDLYNYTKTKKFDAYIVGSDQVWRPKYSPCITNYYLDFAEKQNVKRIAYAASFGVDKWEYTNHQSQKCAILAKKFDMVTVREISAIRLCHKYLGVDAFLALDPTLLLDKDDYIKLVENEKEPKRKGNLFCYILDPSAEKNKLIDNVSHSLCLVPFSIMTKNNIMKENIQLEIENCIFPRVTEWVRSFMDAEMVVTDSFHGCVFSIIFNKLFWVIGNKERGLARFQSLLGLFGLNNRILIDDIDNSFNWEESIDWNLVNKRKSELQLESKKLLQNCLK